MFHRFSVSIFYFFVADVVGILDVDCNRRCAELNLIDKKEINSSITCCFADSGALDETTGFRLQITPSHDSHESSKMYFCMYPGDVFENDAIQQVRFMFQFFGNFANYRSPVCPGFQHYLQIWSLPEFPGNNADFVSNDFPGCDCDERLNQTMNCNRTHSGCILDHHDVNCQNWQTATPSGVKEKGNTTLFVEDQPSNEQLIFLIVALAIGMALTGIIAAMFFRFRMSKRKSARAVTQLFVVISARDVNLKSQQSTAADRMCCCFQQHGLGVTYTLWHATELSHTNAIQWVSEHVNEADHVILILSPNAQTDQPLTNAEEVETQPLLNKAYDPYVITTKKIESLDGNNNNDKYSIVRFDDVEVPATLSDFKACFKLPEDASRLCRRLGRDDIGKSLQKFLQAMQEDAV